MTPDDKKLAKLARERKMHRWLTTLSWSVPAVSFGGMFTIWHAIAKSPVATAAKAMATQSAHTSATHVTSATGRATVRTAAVADPVVLQQGDKGSKVSALQQSLSALGFFNYAITGTYGPITAAAVEAFQAAEGLTPTGVVDERTLTALQQAVKAHATGALTGGSSSSGSSSGSSSSGSSSSGSSSSGSSSSGPSSSGSSSGGGSAMPSFPGPVTSAS
ncbi:peptidoglycan-binding domain-containing protein [Alicyclobacillus mali (ex Roth et al. 2021)]|uniref:peptidoglycan-binding domain-containing protein n=1 Tax=Alicyclobacillus mali (ex Roth et al. 2021) TaxID=1123961 RepID=UPI001A90B60D|nr:peptidoglycan-binding domain-containing protein [Alicyclobacillus mali (ex Roth et al. 2021)]